MGPALDGADLSGNDLAAEAVRSLGELHLRVTGSSMFPAIRPGDVLLIRHCGIEDAAPGEVVLFNRYRRLFAHRVVSRSGAGLVTQGDAIAAPDPSVSASELLGKVIRVLRHGKPIRNRSKLTFSGRLVSALSRRSACVGRLLTRLHGLQHRAGL
jgi:hypothetical protein